MAATVQVLGTRLTECAVCGHRSRLVITTDESVTIRCVVCGDADRVRRTTPPALADPALDLVGQAAVKVSPAS